MFFLPILLKLLYPTYKTAACIKTFIKGFSYRNCEDWKSRLSLSLSLSLSLYIYIYIYIYVYIYIYLSRESINGQRARSASRSMCDASCKTDRSSPLSMITMRMLSPTWYKSHYVIARRFVFIHDLKLCKLQQICKGSYKNIISATCADIIFFASIINNAIKLMSITEFEMIKTMIHVLVTGHDTYIW